MVILCKIVLRLMQPTCGILNISDIVLWSSYRKVTSQRSYATVYDEKDPQPYFVNPRVQQLLRNLTGLDYEKIFRSRKPNHPFSKPKYQFMTKDLLQKELEMIKAKSSELLQMPPVLPPRKQVNHVLSTDPALFGYDESKFVFTDISDVSNKDRLIVVRDPNGTLRKAHWEERERVLQTYFPEPGKKINMPKMFTEEYLKDLLKRGEYEFILNEACVQFEPNDVQYLKITEQTYEHINDADHTDHLRSTRHYGPMMFYLVWTKNLERVLLHLLKEQRLTDAKDVVRLHNIVNVGEEAGENDQMIKKFISESTSKLKGLLELALQSCIEAENLQESRYSSSTNT